MNYIKIATSELRPGDFVVDGHVIDGQMVYGTVLHAFIIAVNCVDWKLEVTYLDKGIFTESWNPGYELWIMR